MVLSAPAEGLDPSEALRVFGFRQATITTWSSRAGEHAQTLHERFFCHLHLPHLQLDELRTKLRSANQVRLALAGHRPLHARFFPSFSWVPARSTWRTCSSTPCDRAWPPFCLPLFTSDGLNGYFSALTAHVGTWLQERRRGRNVRKSAGGGGLDLWPGEKSSRRRKLVRVTHVMRLGTEAALEAGLLGLGLSGRLNPAFIERVNLTVRHGVAALARRSWAKARPAPQLLVHLEWWRASSHFVRPHASLQVALVQPRERGGRLMAQRYRQRTEALAAAGRTTRRWTAREVLSYPEPSVSA
jgi:hypothetical protein